MEVFTLYHGTTEESAALLMRNGWQPAVHQTGGNCGQNRFLYLSTGYEDALWFAQEKGSETVLQLTDIPVAFLRVDPEDGCADTVEEELNHPSGLPGKVILTRPIDASFFSLAAGRNFTV